MKRVIQLAGLTLSVLGITSMANAATPGGYFGVGVGYGNEKVKVETDEITSTNTNKDKASETKNGLAGRIFAGYNFNEYFGVELGYNKFSNATIKTNNTVEIVNTINVPTVEYINVPVISIPGSLGQPPVSINKVEIPGNKQVQEVGTLYTVNKFETTLSSVSLVGKAYLPINQTGFNVYALGGVAYVTSKTSIKSTVTNSITKQEVTASSSDTTYKFLPTYGAGVSYDIPSTQFTTNLEVSHVQGSGNIPASNLATISLAYNFG